MPADVAIYADDPSGCVDVDLLGEALSGVVPPPAALRVVVQANGDQRELSLALGRGGTVAFAQTLHLVAADCPATPESIASAIRAWLRSTEGGRAFAAPETPRIGWWIPASASVGIAEEPDVRGSLGVQTHVPAGPGHVEAGVEFESGTSIPVGIGQAHLAEARAGAGWMWEPGGGRWSLGAGAEAGVARAWGTGFVGDHAEFSPVCSLWAGSALTVVPGFAVRAGLTGVVAGVGFRWEERGEPAATVNEPWLRGELGVEMQIPTRRGAAVKVGAPSGHGQE